MRLKLLFTRILSSFLLLLVIFQANAQPFPGVYTTTWAGNSFVPATNDYNFVQGWANSMFVQGDTIYSNCFWDEGAKELGIYKNGQCIGMIPNQHGHADGGAITANATYIWASVHSGKIQRFLKLDYSEAGTEFQASTDIIRGLAATTSDLYISDYAGNKVNAINAVTGAATRTWAVTHPGPIALDASNNIWVLCYDVNSWGPGTGACIKEYSRFGSLIKTVTLPIGVQAKSITIDKVKNELLVTDIGDNMQVHIYNNLATTPALVESFGTQGGILSGTKGLVAPLKLNVPNLVGVDANSNIIIWSNGNNTDALKTEDADGMGSVVESYTRAGVRNWQMLGLEFVDMGTYDPATDGTDLYTKHEHFTMDYSKPDGQQWTWKGWTLDRKKYPNDKRCHNNGSHLSSTIMRRINGKLFMYLTNMPSGGWYVYRFDENNEGETAVPCGIISQGENLWIDNNGNGVVDAGENPTLFNLPTGEFFGRNIDKNGTIWFATIADGIYKFPVQSVNSFGVPVYDATPAAVVATPAPFSDLRRVEYDADNDVMYLSGYTIAKPYTTDWKSCGLVMARYNNWSTGNRTASYTINLPSIAGNFGSNMVSTAVEKDFIFVVGVQTRGKVWVYNSSNGAFIGAMEPGANVGGINKTGWCDLTLSIAALKKASGEYLVTVEEDGWEKILIYRWNGVVVNVPVTGVSVSPLNISLSAGSGQPLTATILPVNASNIALTWTSSDNAIATVSTDGVVTGVAAGTATITVTTVDGAKTATCTVTVTALVPGAWTVVDDLYPGWTWSGYNLDGCSTCFGGSAHSSDVVNSFATYTFAGTDVEAYCETWDGGGMVDIFIDGILIDSFSQKVPPFGGAKRFAVISGLSSGSHTIKFVAKSTDWTGIDYIRFKTTPPGAVKGVVISPATASVNIGATQQLTPIFTPVNPTNTNVTWATSDQAVATVSATGLVSVIGSGTATITVTTVDGGFTATATITATGQGTWTIADNMDPAWTFTGYTQDNCAACYDASAHYSNVLGATAQYSFTGTEVEAFCETLAGAGSVDILIDGVSKGTYTQDVVPYGGANKFASITGLSNASHIIKFVSSSTSWTGIDYIRFRTMSTLPLQLVSFTAKFINGKSFLQWATESQLNISHFDLERSNDGIQFNKILEVASKGNGTYNTVDEVPLSGYNYYRLKMVDKDGKFSYSNVEAVKVVNNNLISFSIHPNPAKDQLKIVLSNQTKMVNITVFNQLGVKILSKQITGNASIPIGHLTSGVYIVQMMYGGEQKIRRLIKE